MPISPHDDARKIKGRVVDDSAIANGRALVYNAATGKIEFAAAVGGSVAALDDVGDVTITAVASGQYLKWNGTAWVNATLIDDATASGASVFSSNKVNSLLAGYATASALSAHLADTANPHAVTKAQVGLGSVANSLQLVAASNLSDLISVSTARTNLGLGDLATMRLAGSDTYVQFNDGGTIGANVGLTFDKSTGALNVGVGAGGSVNADKLTLGSSVAAGTHVAKILDPGTTNSPLLVAGGNGLVEVWSDLSASTATSFGFGVPGVGGANPTISTYDGATWTGQLEIDLTTGDATFAGNIVAPGISDNISTQRVVVSKAGTTVGTRKQVNFIEGSNVSLTIADNAGADRVDVTITAASGGAPALALDDLTDVTITSVATGNLIRYNGTAWVNTTLAAGDIPNLDASKITSGAFATARLGSSGTANSTSYLRGDQAWATIALDDLSDVVITTVASGNLLRYNGTNWVNATLSSGDIPSLDASKLTSGVLSVARGGTGVGTFGGSNALLYTTAADTLSSITTANSSVLVTNGSGVPSWSTTLPAVSGANLTNLNAGNVSAGTLAAARGGTGLSSYTTGDILYASGATTLAALAGVATGNALISGGTSTAPSWGKVGLTTHVSGTLGVGNGGTGVTTFGGTNKLLYTTATDTLSSIATANSSVLVTDGSGVPSWSTSLPAFTATSVTTTGKITAGNALAGGVGSVSFGTGTISVNSDSYNTLVVGTLTGNLTVSNPTGTPTDGQVLTYVFTQDATGSRTISWGTNFAFGTDITTTTVNGYSTASKSFEVQTKYHSSSGKWRVVAVVGGF